MLTRIKDWLHERKIRAAALRDDWKEVGRLVRARSPEQVARMERKMGLA